MGAAADIVAAVGRMGPVVDAAAAELRALRPAPAPVPVPVPVPTPTVLANYLIGQGWATFGLALPQGSARGGVQVGTLATQTDVKTVWPDGSIRFAVVTAQSPAQAFYGITAGSPSQARFTPVWPSAMAVVTTGGSTYVASLPPFSGADSWLIGDLVRESRVLVTPTAGAIPHPLLQVLFDVRSYAGGGHRLDVCVQNVCDITAGAPVTYDVAIIVNGVQVYAKNGLTQPWLTRWRKVFAVGLTEAEVVPDFEPFYQAKAIPRYLSSVGDPKPLSSGPTFEPLQCGDMAAHMATEGGHGELAPYPNGTAQYLVHKRPEQRAYMLACANLSGSWRGHITEADGQTLISVDKYPAYWLDGRAGTHSTPVWDWHGQGPEATRVTPPAGQPGEGAAWPGGFSEPIETAHMPSLAFVPYLVTGDRYYHDQNRFWTNATILLVNRGSTGGAGVITDFPLHNQVRGMAWAMRSWGDLVAYMPDADPMRDYFRTKLQNNLNKLNTYATAAGGPFEWNFIQSATGDRIAVWMNNYVAWALERCAQHGFTTANALRDRLVRQQLRFFEDNGWPKTVETYYPTVAGKDAAGKFMWLPTMADIYKASMAVDDTHRIEFSGQYDVDARLMLLIAVRDGIPGAQAALDFLMAQRGVAGDVNFRSGWAIERV